MAIRGNVWAAMYDEYEEMEGAAHQTSNKNHPQPNKSQVYGANSFVSETSDIRPPDQTPRGHGIAHGQRSREMFGRPAVGKEGVGSRAKRQKTRNTGLDGLLTDRAAYPTTLERGDDYGQADLSADMVDIAEFAFQNDVQRCETFLDALSTNLKICQEKGRPDVVAKMAKELEKVVDAVNKFS